MTSSPQTAADAGAIAGAIGAACTRRRAGGGASFFVGADEDALLWGNSQQTAAVARSARPELDPDHAPVEAGPDAGARRLPERAEAARSSTRAGIRVVVSVYGMAADAPRTETPAAQYCSFVADLLRDNPEIDDVAIWNDPNDGTFWAPQFAPGGASVAPADYEALLAQCYDAAHAVRKNANVIAVAVSKSSDIPGAFTLAWHPPAAWFAKLSAAYRASRRTQPIFDTLGYIPHPANSAERPWTKHPGSSGISLGDYDDADVDADDRVQRHRPAASPARARRRSGTSPRATRPRPTRPAPASPGTETDPKPVPSWSAQEAADQGEGPGVDQAVQLQDAIRGRVLPARRRRVLQLPPLRRARSRRLAVRRVLARRAAEGRLPGPAERHRRASTRARSTAPRSSAAIPPRPAAVADAGAAEARDPGPAREASVAAFGATVTWQHDDPGERPGLLRPRRLRRPDGVGAGRERRRRPDRLADRARLELQRTASG